MEAPLLLRSLPPEVPFGFLGRVAPAGAPIRIDLELHPIPPAEALALLESSGAVAEAELRAKEGGAPGEAAERELEAESAGELAKAVAGRRQELYRVGIVLRAVGRSVAESQRGLSAVARRLHALGFRTRVPSYEVDGALCPAGAAGDRRRPSGYWHLLSTDGVAAFFPFVDEAVVEPEGILVGLLLEDAGPVILDRYAHASHSWGLFGATGAGKSFAAALWALRTRWSRPDLELFILDPLGEFARFGARLGGEVVGFGPEAPAHWHPLDPASTGGDRVEKAARVGVLLRALFPSLRDEEAARLDASVSRLYERGPELPTFSDLRGSLLRDGGPPDRLADLLDLFVDGSLRHLDRPSGGTPSGAVTVFDLHDIPAPQLPFHLTYVLDGLYDRLRRGGHPKLVLVDEAQLLARSAGSSEFLDRLVRHLRHFRAGLLLLSQSPDDFLAHDAGRSLLRNLRATVLLRLGPVSSEARSFFDLTDAEADWLPRARLPKEAGYSEGLLRFGPAHLPIAVAASTPENEFLTGALGGPGSAPGVPVERHV